MERQNALNIVKKYVKNNSLFQHMLSVEACMRFYANKLDQDTELWGITGLLHDFDWEIHPTMEQHPLEGVPILKNEGVPEIIIRAILSHADYTGVTRDSLMEKALYACDEITGLVTAVALVRPSKSVHDLKVSSVKKKWKNKSFAAGANRDEIITGSEEFGVELWDHVNNIIIAMRSVAADIGLEGNLESK